MKYFLVSFQTQQQIPGVEYPVTKMEMGNFRVNSRKELLDYMYKNGSIILFMMEIKEEEMGEITRYI